MSFDSDARLWIEWIFHRHFSHDIHDRAVRDDVGGRWFYDGGSHVILLDGMGDDQRFRVIMEQMMVTLDFFRWISSAGASPALHIPSKSAYHGTGNTSNP